MADKRITELNLHNSLIFSDVIPIVNSGETKKTTYGTLYYGIRDGVVSGSSQITISDTTGFTEFSSSLSASIALGTNEQDLSNYALISGGNEFIGDQIISGSFTSSLTEGHFFVGNGDNKTQEFPTSSFVQTTQTGSLVQSAYGSFYSTQNQAGVANQIQVITHNVTDFASGVTMVSGSQITFAEAGIYTLISTMQYQETGGGTATITGWLRKNGVDVADSATDLKLKGSGDRDLYAVNYFVSVSAGDYVEFCWSSNDVDTEILYIAPRTSPTRPAVPSVITTVNRVG